MTRRSSAFSRLSHLISAVASVPVVISLPVSRAAWLHHRVRVLAGMPSLVAVSLMARSLNSVGYLWGMVLLFPPWGVGGRCGLNPVHISFLVVAGLVYTGDLDGAGVGFLYSWEDF